MVRRRGRLRAPVGCHGGATNGVDGGLATVLNATADQHER